MPYAPNGIVVDPNGQTVVVTITEQGGGTPTCYTTMSGNVTQANPQTITTRTVFYLADPTLFTVSAKIGSVENANGQGGTATVDLSGGGLGSILVPALSSVETARAQAAEVLLPPTYPPSDDSARISAVPVFTQVSTNVLTQAASGLTSLYSPWVIRIDDKIAGSAYKYAVLYSTNHSAGAGGVGLAYTNNLNGGALVAYGSNPVYQDVALGNQTENVSVVWDDTSSQFIMYYKQITNSPTGTFGSTNYATSTDLIHWTRGGQMITHRTWMPGNGLMGYFKPFKVGEKYGAYHLLGGGNQYFMAMSWSYDGYTWVTDPRPLMYSLDAISAGSRPVGAVTQAFNWHLAFPFQFRGNWWICGTITNFVSGGQNGSLIQVVAPLAPNFRSFAGQPRVVQSNPGATVTDGIGNLIKGADGALYGYNIYNGAVDPPGGVGGGTFGSVRIAP